MNLTDINEIKLLLDRHGFRFSKSMGQNFLINPEIPEMIASMCRVDDGTGVLEIGPGIGCLTASLAKRAGKVVSFELDERLKPVLEETLSSYDNIEIIFRDILRSDIRQTVADRFGSMPAVVCSNLPYNITTSAITALIDSGCFDTITVMVQKEAAERLMAKPGDKNCVFTSVYTDLFYESEALFDVPPSSFIPMPHVESRVIRLTRRSSPLCGEENVAGFLKLTKGIYNQRRKTLLNIICSNYSGFAKNEAEELLLSVGINPQVRGETLSVFQLTDIVNKLTNFQ